MAQSGIATLLGFRGDKPKVPAWVNVDTTEEQAAATAGNLQNLPALAELGEKANAAQAAQFLSMLNNLGIGNLFKTVTSNLESQAKGELPKDVENQVKRYAAEAGIATGTSGSDFNKYRQVRDLGLTSLGISGKALDSTARWIAMVNAGAPQLNFASMFITPQQRIQTTFANRENKWQRDWLHNQIAALPSKEEQAYAQILDYVATFATQAAGVGLGSIGGGAGTGGGAGAAGAKQPFSSAESAAAMRDAYMNNNYGY